MSAAKFVLTSFLLAIAFSAGTAVQAKGVPPTETARATVALSELPLQGRETYALIRAGGKFPY